MVNVSTCVKSEVVRGVWSCSSACIAFGTWLGPSLPRLYGKEPPPPLGLPASGPPGARPAIAVPLPHFVGRNLRPLSSLCKGRPGTERAAYHRPSCPGATHHYLAPPHIQVGSFSQNSSPPCRHGLGTGQAHRTAWLEPILITPSPEAEGRGP